MTNTRITAFTVEGPRISLFISDCGACGVVFGITEDMENRRRQDKKAFYCPNGHSLSFKGKSDTEKLKDVQARELALRDQLSASIREGELTRQALLRDRQRFLNGVCVCCNRSFENVRRHMTSQHPDFDVDKVATGQKFPCSCGSSFTSLKGLRIHQGRSRRDGWDTPSASKWSAHLTRV